jgi:LysM repeat protein
MDEGWVKKFRVLTLSLIFSGALNIGLVAALVAVMLHGNEESRLSQRAAKTSEERKVGNQSLLESMARLTFRELAAQLTNRDLLEEGYTRRDLAVAALVAFHHFNLEKALSSAPLQKREVKIGDREVELYPGLSEDQFDAIIRFVYQEKWPLTTQGLFSFLKKKSSPRDETLEQAFVLTPEFYALQTLFQKTDAPQDPAVLLSLVAEGTWELLDQFSKEQAQMLDFSVEKRRRLLLSYLTHRSPTAATLLLKTDAPFALKKLDDRGIVDLLSVLPGPSEEAKRFCVALLQSPRSDAIWQAAVAALYAFEGEPLPEPLDIRVAAQRFAGSSQPTAKSTPTPAVQTRYHMVAAGESLWKIARQYKVKVDEIVRLNGIEKDRLYPGMTIQIPN